MVGGGCSSGGGGGGGDGGMRKGGVGWRVGWGTIPNTTLSPKMIYNTIMLY